MVLILGSSSPHRRLLLERLALPFTTAAPDCDESPRSGEAPTALVRRLAEGKARSLAGDHPDALIIGSDQVAVCGAKVLTKPGRIEQARAQLQGMSGSTVRFVTGLCLLNTATGRAQTDVVCVDVRMRNLPDTLIERYLALERPFDCAGAFKAEGAGIALVEALTGDDPTALIGLPLVRLTDFLINEGQCPLGGP